jgi:hypothetical protein
MFENIIQRIIRGGDNFSLLVHQFNVFPTQYVHPSYWEGLTDFPQAIKQCLRNPRAEKHLAAYILSDMGYECCYQFQDIAHRIVLLHGHTLEKLTFLLGLTLNARRIKAVVEGRKARFLKKELGENAYLFAIKRATLFGSHSWFWDAAADESDLTREQIVQDGRKCIQLCLSGAPEAMIKRFKLKFAKSVRWDFSENPHLKDKDKAWSLVRKVLLQEVEPRWQMLFNS